MTWPERIILSAYLLAGVVTWLLFIFVMVKGRKRMTLLHRPGFSLPPDPPLISVLVPARDEAGQIEQCLQSILRQDYPRFELVVIDDRSTDGTGEILDRMAAGDRRIKVVHLTHRELPQGWGGKSYALHQGLSQAAGQWLLFVDADVQLEPDVLSQSLAVAVKREFDLVSLLPRFVGADFWERLLQPLAGAATSAMFLIALTNSNESKVAFANGQFLLVKRAAYDAVGGHEAIRGTLSEDVAVARRLKAAGFRPRLGWADGWASVRMYAGLGEVFRGWSRNFYVGSLGRPWRILGLLAFLAVCWLSMFVAAAWGIARPSAAWLTAAGAHFAAMTWALVLMYRWSGNPWWNALLFPIGAAVLVAISVKALWICATGKVQWRGTTYTRGTLRQA